MLTSFRRCSQTAIVAGFRHGTRHYSTPFDPKSQRCTKTAPALDFQGIPGKISSETRNIRRGRTPAQKGLCTMKITTVLFDMDGKMLTMDQEEFTTGYFGLI